MSSAALPLFDRVQAAAEAIKKILPSKTPKAAVVLGTGLGGLAKQIKELKEIPYAKIPHFPVSTVTSHAGRVVTGMLNEAPVLAFDGRFHLYEGWSFEQLTLPVRVAKALGAEVLFLSGAVGGMNPQHEKGDLVLLEDHINLMPGNPLIGPNDERLGPRFPDMCVPYDKKLLARAQQICLEEKIQAHRGVYVAVSGPNLETRAEYRFLRAIGADVVGMSTVPEVIVAVHCGLKVFAASIVTDRCMPDALEPANIAEIIAVANGAEPKLTRLVARLIGEL
jgi:purine-nucleoside phosphorylase